MKKNKHNNYKTNLGFFKPTKLKNHPTHPRRQHDALLCSSTQVPQGVPGFTT